MLHGGMFLDVAVATVVVGEKEAFVTHQFARAAASEQHHGILEGSLVHAVDVFGTQFETLGLHVPDALGDEGGKPHAFVGLEWLERGYKEGRCENMFFHLHTDLYNTNCHQM